MIPRLLLLLAIEGYVLVVGVVRGRLLLDLEARLVLKEDLKLEEAGVIWLLVVLLRLVPLQAFGFGDLDMDALHALEGCEGYGERGRAFKVVLLLKHPELPARLEDSQLILFLRGLPEDQVFHHVAMAHPGLILLEVRFFGHLDERGTGDVMALGQGVLIERGRRGVHQDLTLLGGRRATKGIVPRHSRIRASAKPRSLKLILHVLGRQTEHLHPREVAGA